MKITTSIFGGNDVALSEPGQRGQFDEVSSSSSTAPLAPRAKTEKHGLSMGLAAIFIAGEMAGSGILALPKAVSQAGWFGVVLIFVCCVNSLFSGICLGRCWIILEERWDEYKGKVRYPYPAIASRAVAPWMRYVVSFCVDFTLFGVATVFLLLSSQIIGDIGAKLGVSFCYWILILAAILCPLMWLGTPDDFWPAAVVALVTTVSASLLLVIAIILDKSHVPQPKVEDPTVESFSLAFATILFAFGGASTFPTFQNDMKDKSQFPKSASIAFAILLLLYIPVAVAGYRIYGIDVADSIISSLTRKSDGLTIAIEVLLAIHLFFAFLLAINPPSQEFEEILKIPNKFGWKRCLLRSGMMLVIVFLALSIPRFSKVMDLVGGSTVTLMTFVFPPWFYMKLTSQKDPQWPERTIPLYIKVYLIEIMIIGLVGGVISTYSAITHIATKGSFDPPCYVNSMR